MAYVIHIVERDELPPDHDWLMVEEPDGGDVHLLLSSEVKSFEVPPGVCDVWADAVYKHFRVFSQEPRDYAELLRVG